MNKKITHCLHEQTAFLPPLGYPILLHTSCVSLFSSSTSHSGWGRRGFSHSLSPINGSPVSVLSPLCSFSLASQKGSPLIRGSGSRALSHAVLLSQAWQTTGRVWAVNFCLGDGSLSTACSFSLKINAVFWLSSH